MTEQQLDAVFLALANSSRRQLLDLIAARPGCTLSQLLSQFDISRIGLMKHLQVLLDADLVIAEKQGRERPLYLNAVPLQLIHERWMRILIYVNTHSGECEHPDFPALGLVPF